jgi:hypothetical protein
MSKKGKDKVFVPGENRIFVFGSNLRGIHGAGAAREAYQSYGAIMGQGIGLQGYSYAIPTKDLNIQTLSLEQIKIFVDGFIKFAREWPGLYFFVTRIGCGLAGYTDDEIGPMFRGAPPNVELPYGWGL